MARTWRDQFDAQELRHFELTYGARELEDVTPCHACGVPTPYLLLDAKPGTPARADRRSPDYERLECRDCYGHGWMPT